MRILPERKFVVRFVSGVVGESRRRRKFICIGFVAVGNSSVCDKFVIGVGNYRFAVGKNSESLVPYRRNTVNVVAVKFRNVSVRVADGFFIFDEKI